MQNYLFESFSHDDYFTFEANKKRQVEPVLFGADNKI